MTTDRRYSEEEIEAIFKVASEAQDLAQRRRGHGEGLTISELQEIGGEVGITPEFIAQAAATVERRAAESPPVPVDSPRYLGVPIRAAHAIDLPAPLTDQDWDQLVALCRETFDAPGRVQIDGTLRMWRNGNLQVLLEPTPHGQRLRMSSTSDTARNALNGSMIAMGFALFLTIILAAAGKLLIAKDLALVLTIAGLGLGMGGWAAAQTPRWIRQRNHQMQAIAARAVEMAQGRLSAAPEPASTLAVPQRSFASEAEAPLSSEAEAPLASKAEAPLSSEAEAPLASEAATSTEGPAIDLDEHHANPAEGAEEVDIRPGSRHAGRV